MILESRPTLGAGDQGPSVEADRISIGQPVCVRLDSSNLDPDGQSFVESKPDSMFWLFGISCSFRADARAPLNRAWLELQLTSVQPPDRPAPIAWSMEPVSSEDLVQVGRKATLDGFLKLKSTLIPLEVGSSAAVEETETHGRRVPFVEAHREGTSEPCWFFTRTEMTEIRGVHRLRMVIETGMNSVAQAHVSVGAVIQRKRLGAFTYRAALDDLGHQILQFGDLQD